MNLQTVKKQLAKYEPQIEFNKTVQWLREIKPVFEAAPAAAIVEYLQAEIADSDRPYYQELCRDWLTFLDTDYLELKEKWGWFSWDGRGLPPQLDPDNDAFILSVENDNQRSKKQ